MIIYQYRGLALQRDGRGLDSRSEELIINYYYFRSHTKQGKKRKIETPQKNRRDIRSGVS